MQTETPKAVAHPDFESPPRGSLLRLYDPSTRGNSFSLDGFPAAESGQTWLIRLIEMVERQGVLGMTTNQTLFRSLAEGGVLEERLKALKGQGRSAQEIYRILYNQAATAAGRVFAPVNARWPWEGRVSQEASALLTELEPLVSDVCRISRAMEGVGSFTKVPNLRIGPEAITQAVAAQVQPNVTLVFSDRHYLETVEGYLRGVEVLIEKLKGQGLSESQIRQQVSRLHSVNSLFVSRVDRVVDPMIEEEKGRSRSEEERQRLALLKGKVALAQAKRVYRLFEAIFLGQAPERRSHPGGGCVDWRRSHLRGVRGVSDLARMFERMRHYGAQPQRLLIASSGVKKEQPYSPLLYVLPLMGPWTANTLPEETLKTLSRFVASLEDGEAAALKTRPLVREKLPAIPTDSSPEAWDRAILMSAEERRLAGIGELEPEEVLSEAEHRLFRPRGTSLREICDQLRDKGAAAFMADEEATLKAIERKLEAGGGDHTREE